MKATLAIASITTLGDMKPGQLFRFVFGDESKAICAVLSTDASGFAKPAWDSSVDGQQCGRLQRVVVIASLRAPDEIGYRPTGAVLSISSDFKVVPVEQAGPCAFREACLVN